MLLADSAIVKYTKFPMLTADRLPFPSAVTIVIVLQYLIVTVEMIARFRDDKRGFTLPIAFLPGGVIVRTALMAAAAALVVSIKLAFYFVSVLLQFVFQILHVSRFIGTAHIVDGVDRFLEPCEIGVNRLYNLLYFHKIRANTSVFTSVFNGSLSFWCINH